MVVLWAQACSPVGFRVEDVGVFLLILSTESFPDALPCARRRPYIVTTRAKTKNTQPTSVLARHKWRISQPHGLPEILPQQHSSRTTATAHQHTSRGPHPRGPYRGNPAGTTAATAHITAAGPRHHIPHPHMQVQSNGTTPHQPTLDVLVCQSSALRSSIP